MPNLLVLQHLETLYLGENYVRVVCEKVWRKAQECALKKSLATRSCDWFKTSESPKVANEWSIQGSWRVTPVVVLDDKISSLARQLAHDSNLWLVPVTISSHQNILFSCNWLFAFHIHPTINTLIPTKFWEPLENFERKTLEKNKIDSSTIFILWFSKFIYSHPLHCSILERYINQILISPYPYLWGGCLVLRKQFRRDQFIFLNAMGYCGIW